MRRLVERVAEVVDREPKDERETARDRLKRDAGKLIKDQAKKFLKKELKRRVKEKIRKSKPPANKLHCRRCPAGSKMVFGKCKPVGDR